MITLVIIGVIAALTIPNLLQKYQEQTTVKKVQKFYSNLSNAYNLAMKENGSADDWGLTYRDQEGAEKIYELLFKPYFKIAKNCGANNTGECIKNVNYKLLNNGLVANYGTSTQLYKVVLEDGAVTMWRSSSESESAYVNIYVFYDINGTKEPNQFGRDTFEFFIRDNKVAPSGIQSGKYAHYAFNTYCQKNSTGDGCAAWLIYKGNMDYLHCDLTWNKNSCKDK